MNQRTVPFTTTAEEMDKLLFSILTAEFNALYPNDTRMALRAAMHVTDNAMTHIDALATRAAKSDQARRAAQARYAGTTPPATEAATQAPAAEPSVPVAQFAPPATAPAKPPRVRRTKAQIAAGVPLAAVAQAQPQPVPMGAPFTAEKDLFTPPVQTAPQPVPTAEPPVVTDFAALAKQAAVQGVPQFAPTAAPAFVPPAPTFG